MPLFCIPACRNTIILFEQKLDEHSPELTEQSVRFELVSRRQICTAVLSFVWDDKQRSVLDQQYCDITKSRYDVLLLVFFIHRASFLTRFSRRHIYILTRQGSLYGLVQPSKFWHPEALLTTGAGTETLDPSELKRREVLWRYQTSFHIPDFVRTPATTVTSASTVFVTRLITW